MGNQWATGRFSGGPLIGKGGHWWPNGGAGGPGDAELLENERIDRGIGHDYRGPPDHAEVAHDVPGIHRAKTLRG